MATYPSVPAPDYPINEGEYYSVIVSNLPGKEERRTRHSTVVRSWELTYYGIHSGDCKYLWDFYNARKGEHEKFTFVHPETAVSHTVRFSADNISREEIAENVFNMKATLIEVI